jgi:hypothetical protein
MKTTFKVLWIAGACIALPLQPARASLSLFGGAETDMHAQSFSYLGADLGRKLAGPLHAGVRIMPNYLTYHYFSGADEVKAESPGLFALGGLSLEWPRTSVKLFGGAEFRDTRLSIDHPGAKVRGHTQSGAVQLQLTHTLTSRTNFDVFASYGGTSQFVFERARIKQQITNKTYARPLTLNAGVEQIFGRNVDYHQEGGGGVIELYHIPSRISFAVHGGYKYDSTYRDSAYAGIELGISL